MASFKKYGEQWRVQVFRHGIRASKVLPTKRDAQAWAIRKEAELDALKGSGARSLHTAVQHYLKTVSSTKREGALEWERRRFDAMLEHFGETTFISSIDSEAIGQWRDKRLETVSGSTVQRESNLLRHLFTLATDEWRWLDRNPFKGVRLPANNEARHQLWGWRNIRRVLRAGQRSGGKTGEVALAFHISLRTGMRLQEVLNAPPNYSAPAPGRDGSHQDQYPARGNPHRTDCAQASGARPLHGRPQRGQHPVLQVDQVPDDQGPDVP